MGTGIFKNSKTLYHAKFVNYFLETIKNNLFTLPSTINEGSARTDLLQVAEFTAESW
jgi:hypothetical protein